MNPPLPASVAVPVQLLQSLIVAATIDGKTGVLTYPAWRTRAVAALCEPQHGHGWALLLVDLDRFADLNSRFGHFAVDQVLARIGVALTTAMGHDALVGRFGGDEFVMLVPVRTTAATFAAAETARRAVASLEAVVRGPSSTDDRQIGGLTAAVGAAHHRRQTCGRDPSGVLTALSWAADQALYDAKRAGGNVARLRRPSA